MLVSPISNDDMETTGDNWLHPRSYRFKQWGWDFSSNPVTPNLLFFLCYHNISLINLYILRRENIDKYLSND